MSVKPCIVLPLVLVLLAGVVDAESKSKPNKTCRSAGILKFDPSTRPIQHRKRLEVCSKFQKRTCCNATHTVALRLKIREPVVAKFSRKCQELTEEMICSSCHPLMGTWEMKNVCPSLCNDWFDVCKDEYYAHGGSSSLTPCYGNALVCSPLNELNVNGIECFDGSVPDELGEMEPSEPWQMQLMRMLKEEAENPSGLFISSCFILLTMVLMGKKVVKQIGDPFGGNQLNLMEVRRLQQERYEHGEQVYDDETESSSDENRPSQSTIELSSDGSLPHVTAVATR
ncbi:RxLR-like protein [Plasmopara halstedii]|uniref:RxLR-like protein n=1 Tax=Plasmopara halstedii TaxID=4781 RepID=A0A0P1A6E2_PLAHL|nr:RxLR-like protein [Plasmopara halstedii]CEG36126.1 RxLR-like protein [Plasmopara halstedii]|eukprot:XP_024572495.1 RxLR-like protein [Plasmopara halstedii]